MNKILSDRFETPLGPMVLMARGGTLLLLEFEDATDRVGREMRVRFGAADHQQTDDPFGLSSRVRAYFDGDLKAIEGIETDGGGPAVSVGFSIRCSVRFHREVDPRLTGIVRVGGARTWTTKDAKCTKDTKDAGAFVSFVHFVDIVFQTLSPRT